MKLKTFFLTFAIVFTSFLSATAQTSSDYADTPYWYLGVKGGAQVVPTNFSFPSLIAPSVGINFGRQFFPEFGVRADFQGIWSKTGFKSVDETDNFKYLTGDLDLIFNLTNIFSSNPHRSTISLVTGVGLNYSWETECASNYPWIDRTIVSHDYLWSHNFRLGALVDYNINRNWALNLEVAANNLQEEFNSKWNARTDWQFTAMLGLQYRWGHSSGSDVVREILTPAQTCPTCGKAIDQCQYRGNHPKCSTCGKLLDNCQYAGNHPKCSTCGKLLENCQYAGNHPKCQTCGKLLENCQYNGNHPAASVVEATEEVKPLHVDIFYDLDKYNIRPSEQSKLKVVSEYVKKNNISRIVIKGYADVETGNPRYNQGLSENRVNGIKNELVKTYGIPASKIETSAFGDKVQPFSINDKNRYVSVDVM